MTLSIKEDNISQHYIIMVLESIGRKIHRIWSTDWIKDQKSEEEKLVIAVEKALGNVPADTLLGNNEELDSSPITINLMDIEEEVDGKVSVIK